MNERVDLNFNISQSFLEKLEKMAKDTHSNLESMFLKSIALMDIAIKSQKEGKKLAIINNNNKQIIDEIDGI